MEKMNSTEEQLARVKHICEYTSRGIWKRIDENRELLTLLYQHAPELFERFPFLRGWIASHDHFFTELAGATGTDNIFADADFIYPRPWPDGQVKPIKRWIGSNAPPEV